MRRAGWCCGLRATCAISVSEPVIRFSPILTEQDLLALLDAPPSPATALAVARRPDLTEPLADAIAAGKDSNAIRELLANPSAQIREATLDGLIARAADHAEWHAPLVRRPRLTSRAAKALADIVATHLLETLAGRADLDAETTADLRIRLDAKLAAPVGLSAFDPSSERALQAAHRLAREGRLHEKIFMETARAGHPLLAAAMLAVAAVVPLSVVNHVASLRNAKALVSLVWSAGFSMAAAIVAQSLIGNLPPASMLAAGGDGGFPLPADEMRWQLEFLRRSGR